MKEQTHEFHLSAEELAFLKDVVPDNQSLADLFTHQGSLDRNKFSIRLDRARAEQLRAFLTERLATLGFEKDYSLTNQGQMLEELIDRFYLP